MSNNQRIPFDLNHFLVNLPSNSGVYRYFDDKHTVLYVGKAKNLKKRVNSYFVKQLPSPRIALMVAKIAYIEITVTRSESEALLLENNLIKALNPRYNIVFRDNKSYPLLRFTGHEFPRLTYYRGNLDKKANYFGPYPNMFAVKETMALLQKIFLLRNCSDEFFSNRTRACLQHQISRCSAPCVGLIDAHAYKAEVSNAMRFLQGKTQEVLNELDQKMTHYAQAYQFEEAAIVRDQIAALAQLQHQQAVDNQGNQTVDIIALIKVSELVVLNLAMVRNGKHLGDRIYRPAHTENASLFEVLEAFIKQYYEPDYIAMPSVFIINLAIEDTHIHLHNELHNELNSELNNGINNIPYIIDEKKSLSILKDTLDQPEQNIVQKAINKNKKNKKNEKNTLEPISVNNNQVIKDMGLTTQNKLELQSLFTALAGQTVTIIYKPQGVRHIWLKQALHNAQIAAQRFLSEQTTVLDRLKQLVRILKLDIYLIHQASVLIDKQNLNEIQRLQNLRIECFDISHTNGEATQASCVVFEKIAIQPKQYKRFNITNITLCDDYAAMRQVLTRHYGRIAAMDIPMLPTVILIDGGAGQVAIAKLVFIELGLQAYISRIIGIAKGEGRAIGLETLWFADERLPINLPPNSPALMLLALIRDEAHRFAITGMRSKRAKTRNTSHLESIEGIGPKRRKALLSRFGGIQGVKQATCEDLSNVEEISATLATKIYQQLHGIG